MIIWNFADFSLLHRLKMHKVCIQSLSFSMTENYLASIGKNDERNMIIIWDLKKGKALYGSSLGVNPLKKVSFFNKNDERLIAITSKGILLLTIDHKNKKVRDVKP